MLSLARTAGHRGVSLEAQERAWSLPQSFGCFSPASSSSASRLIVVECEKRLINGTPMSSSNFDSCFSFRPGLRSLLAAMYRSGVRHFSVYSVVPLVRLTRWRRSNPFWRQCYPAYPGSDGSLLWIHTIKLSGESQAERPCQVSRIITGYWTGQRLDQRTKSCQR